MKAHDRENYHNNIVVRSMPRQLDYFLKLIQSQKLTHLQRKISQGRDYFVVHALRRRPWTKAQNEALYLGCVRPLLQVALRQISTFLSVVSFLWPYYSLLLLDVIPPPSFQSSFWSFSVSNLPLNSIWQFLCP